MFSSSTPVYLRPNAILEPLVNRWYAWPYIVSPLTAALYIANHHVKIMQSFVATPQIHVETVKKPGMLGGPFIAHGADKVGAVRALLDRTVREQADMIQLAGAVKSLNDLLAAEGLGSSLEPLYARVPDALRGLVELVYDLHQRPYFRVIEPLLYASKYYKESSQSLALWCSATDERPFALSTPHLDDPAVSMLQLPFASPIIDELARARVTAKPFGFFEDCLGVKDRAALGSMFTEAVSAGAWGGSSSRYAGEGMRVRYLGHACLLAESKRVSVLFDPLVPYKYEGAVERYGFDDLPDFIDYAVITHSHQDHALLETLLQLRHRIGTMVVPSNAAGNVADPSLKLLFRKLGFRNVVAIDELETLELDGGSLTALPFLGEHGDLDVRSKAGHLLRLEGKSILCAADSNNLEQRVYDSVRAMVGAIDAVFIGMECQGAPMSWLYGPLLPKPIVRKNDQSRRLDGSDCTKALGLIDALGPREAYVYAMGAEPWLAFISSIHYTDESRPIVESNRLVQTCRERGIKAERLYGCKDIVIR